MIRLAVFISGGGTNLQAIIDACADQKLDANVELVISNQSQAYGLERAKQAGIPQFCLTDHQKMLELLKQHRIDIVVLAGYLKQIPATLIQTYPNRIINIHPSLIPAFSGKGFYGLKVHQAAIERGVQVSGATVHLVNEELDEGEILIQETVPVYPQDTAEDLQARVLELEHRILIEGIDKVIEKVRKS